jgi:hypothetical protein
VKSLPVAASRLTASFASWREMGRWRRQTLNRRGMCFVEKDKASRPLLQLSLPDVGVPSSRLKVPRASPRSLRSSRIDNDPLFATYARRLVARGAAEKTSDAYRYQLQAILNAAERLMNEPVTLSAMFHIPRRSAELWWTIETSMAVVNFPAGHLHNGDRRFAASPH